MRLDEAKRTGKVIRRPVWGAHEHMRLNAFGRWVDEDDKHCAWVFEDEETKNGGAEDWEVVEPRLSPPCNPDAKETACKDPLGWLPLTALAGVARHMAAGGAKYPRGNYATALYDDATAERYVAAALRHLTKAQDAGGVWTMARVASQRDADTGELELDAVIANLLMLREVIARHGDKP